MNNEAMDSATEGLPWTDPGLSITSRSGSERDVFAALADCFGIDKDEIKERTRRRDIVRPRQMIMYLLREYGGMSFPAIGRLVGNRDHTTVIHSYVKIKNEISTDPQIIDFLSVPISIAGTVKGKKLRIEKELKKLKEQIQLANQDSKDWLKSGDHWVGGNKNMAKSFPKFQKFSQKQGTGVGPPMMLAR